MAMQSNNSQSYLTKAKEREFNLFELALMIKANFWSFVIICLAGTLLSIAIALSRTNVYEVSIELSKPSEADIVALNTNGYSQYEVDEVFKLFYDKSKSKDVFKSFIEKNDLLKEIFPSVEEVKLEKEKERYFSRLFEAFNYSTLGERNENVNFLSEGTNYQLTLKHSNEYLGVDILNKYLPYVRKTLLDEASINESILIAAKKSETLDLIRELRQIGKQKRLYEIERLLEENNKKLEILQQERELLVTRARNSRKTEIEIIEEQNQIKLNELLQKRKLLTIKAKNDRLTQIAKANEAFKIASSLGIVYPTKLDELNGQTGKVTTSINVNDNKELALYLMGTKYLSTLIKTLEQRDDDAMFLKSLNALDMEIETVKNDKKLQQLKERKSDAKFLQELNRIDQEISKVMNDKALKILQERENDDPYIPEIPELTAKIKRLDSLTLDFSNVKPYVVNKPAVVTDNPIGPNKLLIVVVGTFISFMLAIIFLLLKLLYRKLGSTSNGL